MPGKTSTPTGTAPSPLALYRRLVRGTAGIPSPADTLLDADGALHVRPQMAGSACAGQMMAGRCDDPALVHF
ncbi:hypothetical protein [Nitrospirillum pindoramense]|uniref:Uncharacterized protein n=1 Tax=Nitrospirillum amazonense TaxID=28077 RepID=A0A560HH47_9PROT|nr:hypothetical protein [Nitrospirillum amazonense]TWB45763.1 hypothetical protein FBZ90_10196 [Nitrospirillum amazonense]